MKTFVFLLGIIAFSTAVAGAQGLGNSRSGHDMPLVLLPSLNELIDEVYGQPVKTDEMPEKQEGKFTPYLGFTDTNPDKYLVPGEALSMVGGVSYYAPRTERRAGYSLILVVKDNVPNRLQGYAFDGANLIPYFILTFRY